MRFVIILWAAMATLALAQFFRPEDANLGEQDIQHFSQPPHLRPNLRVGHQHLLGFCLRGEKLVQILRFHPNHSPFPNPIQIPLQHTLLVVVVATGIANFPFFFLRMGREKGVPAFTQNCIETTN